MPVPHLKRRSQGIARNLWSVPALVLAATVAIACGGDSATGPNASPVGDFQLSTFNGKALPVTVFADTGFMDVLTAGTLSLSSDGKYLATISVGETIEGHLSVYVDTGSGKWSQSGGDLTLVGADSVRQVAAWNGSVITISDTTARPTSTLVFTKK